MLGLGIKMNVIKTPKSSPPRNETESRAFVVRMVDYRDSDRIVTLFTEETGKVSALARGARKSRKRFGAALSPYMLGNVRLSASLNTGRMPTLSEIQPVESFSSIGKDVVKLALAGYFAELCRETIPDSNPEPGIFDLLLKAYRILDSRRPTKALVRAFELHLLTQLGLSPRLDRCVGSSPDTPCEAELRHANDEEGDSANIAGKPGCFPTVEENYAFDLTLGGALCPSCANRVGSKRITGTSLSCMKRMLTMDFDEIALSEMEIPPHINVQIRQVLGPALVELAGKPLKTMTFIEKLRRWETSENRTRDKEND